MPGWTLSSATLPLPGRSALAWPIWRITSLSIIAEDLRPERRLGDVGVDVDEEVVLVALRLPRGMREDVARVRLHGDFLQFAELRRGALEHGVPP